MKKLTDSNYYSLEANRDYFSVSQYREFVKCEAAAMASICGKYKRPTTRALLVGSFVDTYFEGTLEKFLLENPAVYTRKKELRSEFKKASELITRINSDEKFMAFMSGEKQKILTFELFGTWWKMKMDSFLPDFCITDLKIVANYKTLPLWRYDLQGAIYQKGAEICGYGKLPFYLAVATKERVPNLDIFQIPQSTLDMALREIEQNIGRYLDVKRGLAEPKFCGECDYCKTVKKARIRNYNELLEG